MSLTRTNRIKCDVCGGWVGLNDLADGAASHVLVTPSAYGCEETWDSECRLCKRRADESAAKAIAEEEENNRLETSQFGCVR